ncbi:MAG: phosphotransferase [Pseudomonadota bacterium]
MPKLESSPLSPDDERDLLALCGFCGPAAWELMRGDGSQRRFFRLRAGGRRAVAILAGEGGRAEAESYLYLAGHLRAAGVPVPEVLGALPGGRCVVVEDLGDTHLQDVAVALPESGLEGLYRQVLDVLSHMQVVAAVGLDEGRLHQGPRYDRTVMLEKEAKYFLDNYLRRYLGLGVEWEDLAADFHSLAERASRADSAFFLHRDFQSRNIMVKEGRCHVIDFQAGRFGPRGYDVASLLIDPYTRLPQALQHRLLDYYQQAAGVGDSDGFRRGYVALALQRNLQILGAFGYLGLVRGKTGFLNSIPAAVFSLRHLLQNDDCPALPRLRALAAC